MLQQQKKYRFALVSHSIEIVNIVREYSDPKTEDLFTTIVGLDDAVSTARDLIREGYELILGHGGTGMLIAKSIGQPVVNIPITMLEIIIALLKATTLGNKIGVTSFATGREGFDIIRKVLGLDIVEIIFNSQKELEEKVAEAIDSGVNVIVGGGVSRKTAVRLKTISVIIEPGKQVIQETLALARAVAAARRLDIEYNERLQTILKIMDDGLICVDAYGHLNFYNQTAEAMFGMDLMQYLGRPLPEIGDSLKLIDVITSGNKKSDKIIKVRDNELVVNTLPILNNNLVSGAVSLLKEGNVIQDIDRKLRERIYEKGFIAKRRMTDIVAVSPGMRKLIDKAKKFAKTDAAILVCGETGTGKEFLSQALHNTSFRQKAPFVAVNCAALSETLLESELFGHEEGAFTGAKKGGKIGLFELANHGTIFLDEIGDISSKLQVRLLRVLENKEVLRVGGDRIVPVNVRVISSTHKDLGEEVMAGYFRKDLYYRLAVLRLNIPPLRNRKEDIPELLTPLLKSYKKSLSCITPVMFELIESYYWSGNIRELNSLMESYLILLGTRKNDEYLFIELFEDCKDPLSSRVRKSSGRRNMISSDYVQTGEESGSCTLTKYMETYKQKVIRQTLSQCANNRTLAAKKLSISTNTLWRALKKPEGSDT